MNTYKEEKNNKKYRRKAPGIGGFVKWYFFRFLLAASVCGCCCLGGWFFCDDLVPECFLVALHLDWRAQAHIANTGNDKRVKMPALER